MTSSPPLTSAQLSAINRVCNPSQSAELVDLLTSPTLNLNTTSRTVNKCTPYATPSKKTPLSKPLSAHLNDSEWSAYHPSSSEIRRLNTLSPSPSSPSYTHKGPLPPPPNPTSNPTSTVGSGGITYTLGLPTPNPRTAFSDPPTIPVDYNTPGAHSIPGRFEIQRNRREAEMSAYRAPRDPRVVAGKMVEGGEVEAAGVRTAERKVLGQCISERKLRRGRNRSNTNSTHDLINPSSPSSVGVSPPINASKSLPRWLKSDSMRGLIMLTPGKDLDVRRGKGRGCKDILTGAAGVPSTAEKSGGGIKVGVGGGGKSLGVMGFTEYPNAEDDVGKAYPLAKQRLGKRVIGDKNDSLGCYGKHLAGR